MAQSTQGRVSREAEARIDEVLLTPRVLDRRSYDELSGTLRALIREAVGQSDSLRVSTRDIKSLGESVRTVTGDLRQSLEKATVLAPKIEQQIRRAEQVLAGAIDEASLTGDLESRIEALIRRKLETLEARLDEVFDRVQSRGLDAERLAEQRALQLYESLATKVDDAEHRIDGLGEDVGNVLKAVQEKYLQQVERHADRIRKQVEEADRKLAVFDEEVDEKLAKGCERLDATMKTVDDRLGSMNESIEREGERLSDRVDARIADLEGQLAPVQRVISEQVDQATARLDDLLKRAEARGDDLSEANEWVESRVAAIRTEIEKMSGPQLRAMRDLTRRVESLMEDERVVRLG
ncbi:MAG: hypothetical protein KDA28_03020, partial [Phycisphaerales bacterium]|nr:hypothetical protein [Phycisphaerales bacterium]